MSCGSCRRDELREELRLDRRIGVDEIEVGAVAVRA